MPDIAIIGCGIIGAAVAYELSRYQVSVIVLEKLNDVSNSATKANSAIIHAGYDPAPGSLMAKLNVEGNLLARKLFEKLDVPYRQCGSLVLAFSDNEMPIIKRLYDNGVKNGVPGIKLVSGAKALDMEPNLSREVKGALLAPSAMIVSPWEYALALIETAVRNGTELRLESEVTSIRKTKCGYEIEAAGKTIEAKYVINAAGLYSDEIHDMAAPHAFKIRPDRGEYHLLDKTEGTRVSRVIFQCPAKSGKGVLVAPTVHGNLIVGPNSEIPGGRDDVSTTMDGLAHVMRAARKSVPSIDFKASIRSFSGNRAHTEKDDFIIGEACGAENFFDLAGIKSPGLSSAPAIAVMAVDLLKANGLSLNLKSNFIDTRKRIRFAELSHAERSALIAQNPAYGRVICRCEAVTEGEILATFDSPVPPRSLDAVKRRCNPGMGRCQGGFCGPKVVELLAKWQNTDSVNIPADNTGSHILTGETKIPSKGGGK